MKEFYSAKTFGTLAGSSTALFVALGAVSSAFSWAYPTWLPFILALAISVTLGWYAREDNRTPLPLQGGVWFLNGCLIYLTAVGESSTVESLIVPQTEFVAVATDTGKNGPREPDVRVEDGNEVVAGDTVSQTDTVVIAPVSGGVDSLTSHALVSDSVAVMIRPAPRVTGFTRLASPLRDEGRFETQVLDQRP